MKLKDVKKKNISKILKLIKKEGPISKKDLSKLTGLSAGSLTGICNELIDIHVLEEVGSVSKYNSGRKKILLNINYNYKKVIGIDIKNKFTTILITNINGEIIHEKKLLTDKNIDPHAFLEKVCSNLKNILLENNIANNMILGIGVGILGGVNKEKNSTDYPIGFWNTEVPVKEILENLLNLPVIVDNNVKNLAILELFLDDSLDNFFFLKYGSGIGGSIVSNQKIFYGYNSLAGEMGHTILIPSGDYCPICKRRGCLESTISFKAILNKVSNEFSDSNYPLLYNLADGKKENISIEIILKAAELGSVQICELLRYSAELLAISIINTISLLSPKKIVLCGKLFQNNLYLNYLYSNIYNLQLIDIKDKLQISKISSDIEKLAPAITVIHELFYDKLYLYL